MRNYLSIAIDIILSLLVLVLFIRGNGSILDYIIIVVDLVLVFPIRIWITLRNNRRTQNRSNSPS